MNKFFSSSLFYIFVKSSEGACASLAILAAHPVSHSAEVSEWETMYLMYLYMMYLYLMYLYL